MSDKKRKFRNGNNNIAKYYQEISGAEKVIGHRKLKARALCTHTKAPLVPDLSARDEGGKLVWYCRICGEKVDLNRISDDKLNDAIDTVCQACNTIKMMSGTSEKDRKICEEVAADVQLKLHAYLLQAYKSSLNNGGKQNKQNRRRSGINWVSPE